MDQRRVKGWGGGRGEGGRKGQGTQGHVGRVRTEGGGGGGGRQMEGGGGFTSVLIIAPLCHTHPPLLL